MARKYLTNRALEQHGGIRMLVFDPGGVKATLNCRVGSSWSPGFIQSEYW